MPRRPIVKVPILDSCVRCGQRALPNRALCKSCARKAAEQSDKARDRIQLAREQAALESNLGRAPTVGSGAKEPSAGASVTNTHPPRALPTISLNREEQRQANEAASFGSTVLNDSRWSDFDDGLSAEERFLRMVPEPWERF